MAMKVTIATTVCCDSGDEHVDDDVYDEYEDLDNENEDAMVMVTGTYRQRRERQKTTAALVELWQRRHNM